MQQIVTIGELINRAERINIRSAHLADMAGVSRATLSQGRRAGVDASTRTLRKCLRALQAREIELRDYLIGLHGLPSQQEAAE